jgi:hypothetical protein
MKGPLNRGGGGGGAYIKLNGPIDLTDINSFDIKSNTCMISEYKWPVFPPIK